MSVTAAGLKTNQLLSNLLDPKVYPDKPSRVELKETHMSWIFLTDQYVYKLKKPIRYNSQDYTTLQARFKDAILEIDLNRRLTQNLYFGIIPVTHSCKEGLLVQGKGEPIEWMIKMRRLPDDRMMDYLIRIKKLTVADIQAVSVHLARFYMKGPSIDMQGPEYVSKLMMEIQANYEALSISDYGFSIERLELLCRRLTSFLQDFTDLFFKRAQEGRIVDGHGDLRPEHICIESVDRVTVYDCLQFSTQLRIADCVDELSFLALECERQGSAQSGIIILQSYSEITKDQPPQELIHFYKAYRACMWAKLALYRTKELSQSQWAKWLERANHYVAIAEKDANYLPNISC